MKLSLLTSAMWGGLLLGLVPLLIHLISRRRARHVPFAALEFILASKKKLSRDIHLRQFLLLLVRTLFVLAVAMAFTQPLLQNILDDESSSSPVAFFFLLDTSASMHTTFDGKSIFERSLQQAEETLDEIPNDTPIGVLSCGSQVHDVIGLPTFDQKMVRESLRTLRAGYGHGSILDCLNHAYALLAKTHWDGTHSIVVFSDLAAHAFKEGKIASPSRPSQVEWVPPDVDIVIPNRGLHEVHLDRQFNKGENTVQIRFTMGQYQGIASDHMVDLMRQDEPVARQVIRLEEGMRKKMIFTHALRSLQEEQRGAKPNLDENPKGIQVKLRINDDAYALDNQIDIPIELPPSLHVVIVNGDPQAVRFRDEAFYLESALKNYKRDWVKLRLTIVTSGKIAQGILADAHVVVLANVALLEDSETAALIDFVNAGGGLLMSMGDQIDAEWANRKLGDLLPGTLRGEKSQELLDDSSLRPSLAMSRVQSSHPAFQSLVHGEKQTLIGLAQVRTQKSMLLEPDPNAPRQVLISFSDQTPALVEREVGNGRVLLLATSLDRDWSDFSIRPGFVPLMNHLMLYLAGITRQTVAPFVPSGQTRVVSLPDGATSARIRFPNGEIRDFGKADFVQPKERATAAGASFPPGAFLEFTGTHPPGLYRVFANGTANTDHATERADTELHTERFVVLPPPEESDLSRVSQEKLDDVLPEGVKGKTRRSAMHEDIPIWSWLFFFAVVFLLMETAFLRRS